MGSTGQTACAKCLPGFYSAAAEATQCTKCEVGRYVNISAATVCVNCPTGFFQASPSQPRCSACAAGKFAEREEASKCKECEGRTFSPAGASGCDGCVKSYFREARHTGEAVEWGVDSAARGPIGEEDEPVEWLGCRRCPVGTTCKEDGGSSTLELKLKANYWRVSRYTAVVHACSLTDSCRGGTNLSRYCAPGHDG